MNIVFFFRKHNPNYHSIEKVFDSIQPFISKSINFINYYAKFQSKGIFKRIYNAIEAIFQQQDINHITGDIHYIAYFLQKSKTILTIHDIEILKRKKGLTRFFIYLLWFYIPIRSVRFVTVISEFTKRELLNILKINPDKIVVIHNPVSLMFQYQFKEFNSQCPVLLQIGTKANKNISNLVKAISGMKCKLVIIGKLTESQTKMLAEYHIDYQNVFNISEDELIVQYQKADILTFISTYEGFGLPIVEANAIGRVVVTSNISSMPEIANDAALLIDPLNVSEIRNAIQTLIADKQKRETLIANGLRNAQRFQPQKIAESYIKLYKCVKNLPDF